MQRTLLYRLSIGLALAAALVALGSTPAHAQAAPDDTTTVRQVEILSADSLTGALLDGEAVRRLIGSVRLRQGETFLSAREATQYTGRDEIIFTGGVRITEAGDSLTADRVRYDTQQKVGHATGRVRLSDGEVVVRAPSGTYFTQEKRAEFHEGVTLEDSASVLTSRSGAYFLDDKRAEFYEEVELTGDRSYLEADSVTYFRETEVSDARGNVFIERFGDDEEPTEADSLRRTLLFGERAFNDNRERYSRVEGRAFLLQLRADSAGAVPDTLLGQSARMEAIRQDSLERLIAVGSVRLWQRDLSATADSLVYDRILSSDGQEPERGETRLFRRPMAWVEQAQISGDTIRVTGRDRTADTLFVRSNAFLAQRDTVLERIQQLKGRNLTAHFEQDSLRYMLVGPNAETIRFLASNDNEPSGAVEVSSDFIDFWFRDGEVRRMNVRGNPEGVRYEQDQLPEPFELSGFHWVPEERPTRQRLLADERVRRWLETDPDEEPPPPPVAEETTDPAATDPKPQ